MNKYLTILGFLSVQSLAYGGAYIPTGADALYQIKTYNKIEVTNYQYADPSDNFTSVEVEVTVVNCQNDLAPVTYTVERTATGKARIIASVLAFDNSWSKKPGCEISFRTNQKTFEIELPGIVAKDDIIVEINPNLASIRQH